MEELTLVILAAGMGSRFGGLKQVEPIGPNNEFIMDYSIHDAIKAGFNKVIFVIKEENYELFKETVGKRVETKIKVEYVFQKNSDVPEGYSIPIERQKPLGTAQAIYAIRNNINGPFAVIASDDFYGADAFRVVGEHLKNNNTGAIVGYEIGKTLSVNGAVKRGVIFSENNVVTKIIESSVSEKGDDVYCEPLNGTSAYYVPKNQPVSMLIMGLPKSTIDYIKTDFSKFLDESKDLLNDEYLLPEVLNDMINKKVLDINLLTTTASWKGITYKEDLEEFKQYILDKINKGEYPNSLY